MAEVVGRSIEDEIALATRNRNVGLERLSGVILGQIADELIRVRRILQDMYDREPPKGRRRRPR